MNLYWILYIFDSEDLLKVMLKKLLFLVNFEGSDFFESSEFVIWLILFIC